MTDQERDYEGMREFQAKFIEADQVARALKEQNAELRIFIESQKDEIRQVKRQTAQRCWRIAESASRDCGDYLSAPELSVWIADRIRKEFYLP